MKKIYSLFLMLIFINGCDKINYTKKNIEKKINQISVDKRLNKIKNKFNIAVISSTNDFYFTVLNNPIPSVVLFYSRESAPSIFAKNNFQALTTNCSKKINFAQVDLSDYSLEPLGLKYSIFTIPTFACFHNGKEKDRFVGIINKNSFNSLIK